MGDISARAGGGRGRGGVLNVETAFGLITDGDGDRLKRYVP